MDRLIEAVRELLDKPWAPPRFRLTCLAAILAGNAKALKCRKGWSPMPSGGSGSCRGWRLRPSGNG
jgi:hypothetical protein